MKIEPKNGIEPLFKCASILFTALHFVLPLNYLDKKTKEYINDVKTNRRIQLLILLCNTTMSARSKGLEPFHPYI